MAFAADNFSGSSGALLHVYDSAWVRYSSSNGNGTITPAGRVRGSLAGILLYYHTATPASADYSVSADIYRASTETSARACVTIRQATGSMTCYAAGFDGDGGIWLSRLVSGSETMLAKVTHSFPQGETRRIRLEGIGSAIKVYVDGSPTPAISVTDATITAAGKAGLRLGFFASAVPTDSTCMHIDNWEAADPAGPAAELEGNAIAVAGAAGELTTQIHLTGDAAVASTAAGTLETQIAMQGAAGAVASSSAWLTSQGEFASDNFAGGPGVDLRDYSPAWSRLQTAPSQSVIVSDQQRARNGGAWTAVYIHSTSPPSPDYIVTADIYVASATDTAEILGRGSQTVTTHYYLVLSPGALTLRKAVAGVATYLGSHLATAPEGDTIRIALSMSGSVLRAFRDGVEVITVNDTSISDAGRAGVRFYSSVAPSDAVGMHLDNFLATALPAALRGAGQSDASATGDLHTQIRLTGHAEALATAVGSLDTQIRLAADATAQASSTADLALPSGLVAAAGAEATAIGDLDTQIRLSGAAWAQAISSAALTAGVDLSAAAVAQAAAVGALDTAIRLAAVAAAQAVATGNLMVPTDMAGTAVAQATATGELSTQIRMVGNAWAEAVSSAAFSLGIGLSAASVAHAAAVGTLDTAIRLAATVSARASASGTLKTGSMHQVATLLTHHALSGARLRNLVRPL